ncbi:hypothetical protein F5883DRAFT_526626 [Diaporthe sp. PMI_573]|nr:hypothetical protein F5883DRAFT_526626 [Diaporthaceae sp. PMI_573]
MTRLCDLEKLLEYKGVQVRLQQWTPPYGLSTPLDPDNDPRKDQWTKFFSLWVKDASYQAEKSLKEYSTTQQASSLETADPSIADARLGGTSLNAPDVDGPLPGVPNNTPLYDKSLQSFVNSVSKVNQPASQFASHHQHNLDVAIKQEEFGSGVYRRPPFRSKSTTSSPMMGYAGFTQSTFSIPTSAPSSVQSSHISAVIEGSANHQHLHTTSAEASAAAAQMNRTVHTPPNNSPQAVTAAHHRVVAYNSPQQAAVVQPYHHQQQQEELAPAEWMNSCSGPANGMLTAQQVPNGAEPFHPTTPTHSWHWAARSGSGDQGGGRVEGGA